jgi:putative transposase
MGLGCVKTHLGEGRAELFSQLPSSERGCPYNRLPHRPEPLNLLQKWVESVTLREADMKQSRFTEERIIAVLREQEAGSKTGDVCRKHGISSATFYKWKTKYGGLDVSEARRLKVLTDENAKLKKLLAEAMLDNAMLKDLNSKKW